MGDDTACQSGPPPGGPGPRRCGASGPGGSRRRLRERQTAAGELLPASMQHVEDPWGRHACHMRVGPMAARHTHMTAPRLASMVVGTQTVLGGGAQTNASPPPTPRPPRPPDPPTPPDPGGIPGYCICAQEVISTKRMKKVGSSVASQTIGTFLS